MPVGVAVAVGFAVGCIVEVAVGVGVGVSVGVGVTVAVDVGVKTWPRISPGPLLTVWMFMYVSSESKPVSWPADRVALPESCTTGVAQTKENTDWGADRRQTVKMGIIHVARHAGVGARDLDFAGTRVHHDDSRPARREASDGWCGDFLTRVQRDLSPLNVWVDDLAANLARTVIDGVDVDVRELGE